MFFCLTNLLAFPRDIPPLCLRISQLRNDSPLIAIVLICLNFEKKRKKRGNVWPHCSGTVSMWHQMSPAISSLIWKPFGGSWVSKEMMEQQSNSPNYQVCFNVLLLTWSLQLMMKLRIFFPSLRSSPQTSDEEKTKLKKSPCLYLISRK